MEDIIPRFLVNFSCETRMWHLSKAWRLCPLNYGRPKYLAVFLVILELKSYIREFWPGRNETEGGEMERGGIKTGERMERSSHQNVYIQQRLHLKLI